MWVHLYLPSTLPVYTVKRSFWRPAQFKKTVYPYISFLEAPDINDNSFFFLDFKLKSCWAIEEPFT